MASKVVAIHPETRSDLVHVIDDVDIIGIPSITIAMANRLFRYRRESLVHPQDLGGVLGRYAG